MADFYCDFSLTGTGYAGTSANPFSFADWRTHSKNGNTYYCKGSADYAGSINDTSVFTLRAWNIALYGPWRIRIYGSFYHFNCQAAQIFDGILYANQVSYMTATRVFILTNTPNYLQNACYSNRVNCTLYDKDYSYSTITTLLISGCAWKAYPGGMDSLAYGITVQNCKLNVSQLYGSPPTLYSNSYVGGTNIMGSGNSFNWTFPSEPAWDDPVLTHFDLAPGYGVGAPGSWAEPQAPAPTGNSILWIRFYRNS